MNGAERIGFGARSGFEPETQRDGPGMLEISAPDALGAAIRIEERGGDGEAMRESFSRIRRTDTPASAEEDGLHCFAARLVIRRSLRGVYRQVKNGRGRMKFADVDGIHAELGENRVAVQAGPSFEEHQAHLISRIEVVGEFSGAFIGRVTGR